MTDTFLHGYGRLGWPAARALLDGCACVWTDFDGIHLTDTPPEHRPPAATHLWGWTADHLVRLRFDAGAVDAVYAAVLGGSPGPGVPLLTERVAPVVRPVILRPADDPRSGPLPPAITERQWHLTEVPGESPVAFLQAAPR